MNKIILMAAIGFAGTGFAASAQDSAPAAGAAKKSGKVICKTLGETGSRLSKNRVCRTAAEWDEQRRIDRANIDRAQTNQFNKSQ